MRRKERCSPAFLSAVIPSVCFVLLCSTACFSHTLPVASIFSKFLGYISFTVSRLLRLNAAQVTDEGRHIHDSGVEAWKGLLRMAFDEPTKKAADIPGGGLSRVHSYEPWTKAFDTRGGTASETVTPKFIKELQERALQKTVIDLEPDDGGGDFVPSGGPTTDGGGEFAPSSGPRVCSYYYYYYCYYYYYYYYYYYRSPKGSECHGERPSSGPALDDFYTGPSSGPYYSYYGPCGGTSTSTISTQTSPTSESSTTSTSTATTESSATSESSSTSTSSSESSLTSDSTSTSSSSSTSTSSSLPSKTSASTTTSSSTSTGTTTSSSKSTSTSTATTASTSTRTSTSTTASSTTSSSTSTSSSSTTYTTSTTTSSSTSTSRSTMTTSSSSTTTTTPTPTSTSSTTTSTSTSSTRSTSSTSSTSTSESSSTSTHTSVSSSSSSTSSTMSSSTSTATSLTTSTSTTVSTSSSSTTTSLSSTSSKSSSSSSTSTTMSTISSSSTSTSSRSSRSSSTSTSTSITSSTSTSPSSSSSTSISTFSTSTSTSHTTVTSTTLSTSTSSSTSTTFGSTSTSTSTSSSTSTVTFGSCTQNLVTITIMVANFNSSGQGSTSGLQQLFASYLGTTSSCVSFSSSTSRRLAALPQLGLPDLPASVDQEMTELQGPLTGQSEDSQGLGMELDEDHSSESQLDDNVTDTPVGENLTDSTPWDENSSSLLDDLDGDALLEYRRLTATGPSTTTTTNTTTTTTTTTTTVAGTTTTVGGGATTTAGSALTAITVTAGVSASTSTSEVEAALNVSTFQQDLCSTADTAGCEVAAPVVVPASTTTTTSSSTSTVTTTSSTETSTSTWTTDRDTTRVETTTTSTSVTMSSTTTSSSTSTSSTTTVSTSSTSTTTTTTISSSSTSTTTTTTVSTSSTSTSESSVTSTSTATTSSSLTSVTTLSSTSTSTSTSTTLSEGIMSGDYWFAGDGLQAGEVRAGTRNALGRYFDVDPATKVGARTLAQQASRRLLPVRNLQMTGQRQSSPSNVRVERRLQEVWEVAFSVRIPPAAFDSATELLESLTEDADDFAVILAEELAEVASNSSALTASFSMGVFFEPAPDSVVNEVIAQVEQVEVSLVEQLLAGNDTKINGTVEGMTIVAQKFDAEEAANSNESIIVEAGEDITIEVQPETIASLGAAAGSSIVIVVTPLTAIESTTDDDNETVRDEDIVDAEVQEGDFVQAAIKIDVYDSEGGTYNLENLQEPIILTFAITDERADCYVWDVQLTDWTRYGLTTISKTNDTLVCSTTHLSLFAAIARGFLSSIKCSQASLLSEDGLKELSKGTWFYQPAAVLLWITIALFGLVLVLAIRLDFERWRDDKWRDTHFLITEADIPQDALDRAGRAGSRQSFEGAGGFAVTAALAGCCALLVEAAAVIYEMLSELLAEVLGDVFEYVGEVQEAVVGFCSGLSGAHSGVVAGAEASGAPFLASVLMLASRQAIVSSAHRNACADLGIHHHDAYDDAVLAILQLAEQAGSKEGSADDGSGEAGQSRTQSRRSEVTTAESVDASPRSRPSARPSKNWGDRRSTTKATLKSAKTKGSLDSAKLNRLRTTVIAGSQTAERMSQHASNLERMHLEQLERVHHHHGFMHRLRRIPRSVTRQIVKLGPLGSCLAFSIWTPSSLRVLLLFCDVFGAVTVATIFMEASGADPSKDNPDECEAADWGELIGSLLAYGVCSAIISLIPLAILGRLHKRRFVRIDYRGSPKWKRQLRIWVLMDVILWVVGLAYGAFCVLYICLFMANVDPEDHLPWLITAGTSFSSTLVVAPLGVAVLPAVMAAVLVSILACWMRKKRKEVLKMVLAIGQDEEDEDDAAHGEVASPDEAGGNVPREGAGEPESAGEASAQERAADENDVKTGSSRDAHQQITTLISRINEVALKAEDQQVSREDTRTSPIDVVLDLGRDSDVEDLEESPRIADSEDVAEEAAHVNGVLGKTPTPSLPGPALEYRV